MSIRPTVLTPWPQASLPWPGAEERCPKCQGRGEVYYLRAHQPAVEVLGGKRIICPVCAGAGTVTSARPKGTGGSRSRLNASDLPPKELFRKHQARLPTLVTAARQALAQPQAANPPMKSSNKTNR